MERCQQALQEGPKAQQRAHQQAQQRAAAQQRPGSPAVQLGPDKLAASSPGPDTIAPCSPSSGGRGAGGVEESEAEGATAWRPLIHEAIDDVCARARALQAEGVEVQMVASFIEVGIISWRWD